jgi:hypothetical protein
MNVAAVPEQWIGGAIERTEIRQIKQHAPLLETLSSFRTTVEFANGGTSGAKGGELDIG